MISVKDLKKAYGDKKVLDGVTFDVAEGSIFALLGENGAGKTTTVRILSTLISYDSGSATINGFDSMKQSNQVKPLISLTGQYAAVDELLTAKENLIMMGRLSGLTKKAAHQRATELLEQFDLTKVAHKAVKTFSGGMKRRVDIAVSLLASPKVIFLDEPTTGLDPRSRLNMWQFIRSLAQNGATIFLTTQYLEEAEQLADQIAVIHSGKIVVTGTSNELTALVGDNKIKLDFEEEGIAKQAENLLDGIAQGASVTCTVSREVATEKLRQVLNTLHQHAIQPSDVHLIKPTLDDVFMNLTRKEV